MNNLQQRDQNISALHAIRTQEEVACIMTDRGYPMSRNAVYQIERRAMAKLARIPILAALAADLGLTPEVFQSE